MLLLQPQVRALTPTGHCPVFLPLVGDTEWGLKAQQVFNRRRSGRASELRANTAAGGSTEPTAHIMAFGLKERPGEVAGGAQLMVTCTEPPDGGRGQGLHPGLGATDHQLSIHALDR